MLAVAQKIQRSRRVRHSHGNTLSEFVSNFLVRNGQSSFTADPDGFGQVAQEATGEKVKNFTYRADGKPSSFQSGSRTVNSFYDALGRLVAQQVNDNGNLFTNSFLYLGMSNQILQAKTGDGAITTYIDGQGPNEHLGEVKNGVGKGYINDHMGSVLNSPAAGSSHSYGVFGEVSANIPVNATTSPVMYAWQGLRYDPITGDYDNDARRYNQKTGTFTSQDPSGLAGGINLYGSRNNNPLLYVDLDGRDAQVYTTPPPVTHAVVGITDPNSPTGVTYYDYGPKSGLGLGTPVPGRVNTSTDYPLPLIPIPGQHYPGTPEQDRDARNRAEAIKNLPGEEYPYTPVPGLTDYPYKTPGNNCYDFASEITKPYRRSK